MQERLPGRPLAHVWPTLTDEQREKAVARPRRRGSPRSTAPRRRPTSRRSSTPRSSSRWASADPTGPCVAALRAGDTARARRSRPLRGGAGPGEAAGTRPSSRSSRRRSCTATSPSRTSCGTTTRSPRCSTSSGPGPDRATSTSTSSCGARPIPTCTWREAYVVADAHRGLRRGALVARPGLPEPVRVPAPDRPGADLLDRLRRARPARRAPDRRRRATSPSSTPTTGSSGSCTAGATSTSSAAAAI